MKIMNTVFTDHLGVETRSSFQSQCHAIETLAMQPRRAAEEPNSQSVSPVVRRCQRKDTPGGGGHYEKFTQLNIDFLSVMK